MESKILGASLLGEEKTLFGLGSQKPMYVPTAALVTNLSAHFKWGRENPHWFGLHRLIRLNR